MADQFGGIPVVGEVDKFGGVPIGQDKLTEEQFAAQYGDIPDIEGAMEERAPAQSQEQGFSDQAIGAGEALLTTATGATGGLAGNIVGTLKGLAEEIVAGNYGSQEAANRILQSGQELASKLTYAPRTESGREIVETVGEVGEQLAPLAGLGGQISQLGKMGKLAKPQIQQATKAAIKPVASVGSAIFSYQTPMKQKLGRMIESYSADTDTAKYKIGTPSIGDKPKSKLMQALDAGGPKIKKDKIAISAIDQGFDQGVVASIKGAAPADRAAMLKMLNVYDKGRKDALFASTNRPSDIVGSRIIETFNTVKKANRKAGKSIDIVAKNLRGKSVDSAPIGRNFIDSLDNIGVKVGDDFKLIFKGSDVEDLAGVEKTLSNVFRRMTGTKSPDAYELHRMKRFIDEQVSYGKAAEGLTGKSEKILKDLRRNIDDTLDAKFPEYNKANTIYSDTIEAINSLQDVAGKKLDLSGDNANKALGTLMRRVLSNAQSRVNVIEAVSEIEKISKKYPSQILIEGGKTFGRKPDITQLLLFADELDARFKPAARTSLQGQVEQVANRGRQISQASSPTLAAADAVVGAGARAIDKIRGRNDDGALRIMRELLTEKTTKNQNQ